MAILTPQRLRTLPSPAAGLWPGLFDRRSAPAHAAVAKAVARNALRILPMRLTFPDGRVWGTGGPDSPTLQVVNPRAFFTRIGVDGLIGFGEAFMAGDLTAGNWLAGHPTVPERVNEATDELVRALTVMAGRMSGLVPGFLQKLRLAWQSRQPASEENTAQQAKDNISRHYDLSNDLFKSFLDPTLSYSAAWYESTDSDSDLETAQFRKIDGILDYAGVKPGDRLLEIGSGWGALAMRAAAERGAEVTTLTLSEEQKALADKRIAEAGLSDRIEVRLEDYRVHANSNPGQYDAVVSVEMIEAVGDKYWPDYFSAIEKMLTPGGRFGLQAITIDHDRYVATRRGYTWVHKYIFPGGILPSLKAIDDTLAGHTGLQVTQGRRLGPSYATTLRQWRHNFNTNVDAVAEAGFDQTFIRMWNFYLAYCESGFASNYLDDWQLSITRR